MASPLNGRSVVITRAAAQNESFRLLLEARGAHVIEVPLIAIAEPDDEGRERDEVLQRLHEFDWIVITSPNGAERVAPFVAAAQAAGDARSLPTIAVIGEATARSLGITPSLVAVPARADVLAGQFPSGNGTVLLVQGNLADDSLRASLSDKGWTVTRVVAYQTVHLRPSPEVEQSAMTADVLMLASGSAATGWHEAFSTSTPAVVVAMGPSTEKVAAALGIDVTGTATDQTLESMIETAERLCGNRSQ